MRLETRRSTIAATLALALAALGGPSGTPRALASPFTNCDWVGTWATALTPASFFDTGRSLSGFEDESIRMIVQTSIAGDRIRVRLSNAYGDGDLVIGHASIARPATPSAPDLDPHTVRELSFGGTRSVTVRAGDEVVSDPVPMFVPQLSQLAVTLYLPHATGPTSWHLFARQTAFVYDGDHVTKSSGQGYTSTFEHFYFLAGIEVPDDHRVAGAVVVLGASISDGFAAAVDVNRRWPDLLARRILQERRDVRRLGVLNLAVSGNAITHDGDEVGLPEIGASGVHRLSPDVTQQPGVRSVIVDLGLNDIFLHDDPPERMIAGLGQIADELHERGLRVLLATLSPAAGPATWTPAREATRQAVNLYIRTTPDIDGVVDVDLAIRDPENPTHVNPAFDSGDNVHPNDLGSSAIARVVPIGLL
jgi:lysophospholipase L1-like esterase